MLNITPTRAFQDNYIWIIRSADSQRAAIVDPGDARPVLYALREEGVTPVAILITHHHKDHVVGVRPMLEH